MRPAVGYARRYPSAYAPPRGHTPPARHPYRDLVLADRPVAYYRLGDPVTGRVAVDECGGPAGAFTDTGITSPASNLLRGSPGASTIFTTGGLTIEGHAGVASIDEEWTIEALMFYDGGAYRTICQSDNVWFGVAIAHPTNIYVFNRGSGGGIDFDTPLPSLEPAHVAVTRNAQGEMTGYVNGEGGGAITVERDESEEELLPPTMCVVGRAIGGDNPFGPYPLQEWALYDHVLTPGQVRAHSAATGR